MYNDQNFSRYKHEINVSDNLRYMHFAIDQYSGMEYPIPTSKIDSKFHFSYIDVLWKSNPRHFNMFVIKVSSEW